MESKAAGWTAVFISILCGATFTPFAKSLSGNLSALSLLFVSEVLTFSFVALAFGLVPLLRDLLKADRTTGLAMLAVGLCSGVAGPLLWFAGLHGTSAVNAIFFGKVELVFLMVLASTFVHERVTLRHYLISGVILFGAVIIALKGFTDGLIPASGDLAIVASAFFYSLGSCIFRKYLSHLAPQTAVLARTLTAIAAFFLISPFVQHPFINEVRAFPLYMIPTLIGFGFISRFLNTFTFYEAAERLPLSTIYPVFMLDVIGSAIIAHAILGESLAWYHFVGGALILIGNFWLHSLGVHENDEHVEQHAVERVAHR